MTITSLFPPLPTMPKGTRAFRIDSSKRIKGMRLEMEQNPIRPVRTRRKAKTSRTLSSSMKAANPK